MNDANVNAQITFLFVSDLRRSAAFYEDIMGMSLVKDQGSCRIYRLAGSEAYLGICEREQAEANGDTLIFTLVTSEVDAWYQRITSRGWACDNPPGTNQRYKIYHFFLRDPDGYKLEIQRFLDDDWNAGA